MLKDLIDKQRSFTNHFFDSFNFPEIEKLIDLLLQNTGITFFSGVGKSGLVAEKIAYTLASTGSRALFLSPTNALHGDLGMVSPQDVFILLSKSGESDELIHLAPAIRNKGAIVVGILCSSHSRLSHLCHHTVVLPFQSELCPYDMAPTMSTTFQMLLGDLLTVALMKKKNFSLTDYALNHPSGRIGKRMILKVKDLMLKGERIPLCRPDDSLETVLVELTDKRCGCLFVIDGDGKLKGIFTDGDLRRSLQKHGGDVLKIQIKDLMTPKVSTINQNALAWDAMKLMESNPLKRFTVLAVVDEDQRVQGLIHLHDIVQSGI